MNLRAAIVCVLWLAHLSYAQKPQDIAKRAEEMMAQARQLSDIRTTGASAFRLKANFSFRTADLDEAHGTYTETWVSSSKWRRETVVNDVKRIEIGGPSKYWVLESTPEFPDPASRVSSVMALLPSLDQTFDFKTIEAGVGQPPSECAITDRAPQQILHAFCFENSSGLLLENVSGESRPNNLVNFSCSYGTFKKFGNFWFPYKVVCFIDRHRILDVAVIELTVGSPDQSIFTAPPGAIELDVCAGEKIAPVASDLSRLHAEIPTALLREMVIVDLSVVVDTAGKPRDAKVLFPHDAKTDERALREIRDWRFKPATCDGHPITVRVKVEVPTISAH